MPFQKLQKRLLYYSKPLFLCSFTCYDDDVPIFRDDLPVQSVCLPYEARQSVADYGIADLFADDDSKLPRPLRLVHDEKSVCHGAADFVYPVKFTGLFQRIDITHTFPLSLTLLSN